MHFIYSATYLKLCEFLAIFLCQNFQYFYLKRETAAKEAADSSHPTDVFQLIVHLVANPSDLKQITMSVFGRMNPSE